MYCVCFCVFLYHVVFVIGVGLNLFVFVTRVVFVFVYLLYYVVFVIRAGHNLCVFVTRGKTIHRCTILQHSFAFGVHNSFFYLVYIETAAMGRRSPVNNYQHAQIQKCNNAKTSTKHGLEAK